MDYMVACVERINYFLHFIFKSLHVSSHAVIVIINFFDSCVNTKRLSIFLIKPLLTYNKKEYKNQHIIVISHLRNFFRSIRRHPSSFYPGCLHVDAHF